MVLAVVSTSLALALAPASASGAGAATAPSASGPLGFVKHVVVLMQENHSFDNALGKFCNEVAAKLIVRPGTGSKCDGATVGTDVSGPVPLAAAPDIVSPSSHDVTTQVADIDGGKMDGFDVQGPCETAPTNCYSQYDPLSGPCTSSTRSCIPNLSTLATTYAVSDRTFELYQSPSWEGHMYLVTANQDGFYGFNPQVSATGPTAVRRGGGWGCDSGASTQWDDAGSLVLVPSCIPTRSGGLGPNWTGYTGPKAAYVPTIFDKLDNAGLTWKIYGGDAASSGNGTFQGSGWQWAICPTFAECLYSSAQRNHLVPATQIQTDAAHGALPAFSIITPTAANSQHNAYSMSRGDNYIGRIVSAIEASPDWSSTVIFITYDDCGCFYDHVNPLQYNSQWGVRVPMVIVSPFSKEGFTDSKPTTFAGILRFAEKAFNMTALNGTDGSAYDYGDSFCFIPSSTCTPVGTTPVAMSTQRVQAPSAAQLEAQRQAAKDDT
jgi:phospholipase C